MNTRHLISTAACAVLVAALPAHAQTWLEPGDRFVPREGARDDEGLTRGKLGVLLPSYGRKTLYAAYRVLMLPPGATAGESHARRPGTPESPQEAKDLWLKARGEVRRDAARPIDYYKPYGSGIQGAFGNCGGSAFETAASLLAELKVNPALKPADLSTWIDGQDAVFDQCAAPPGNAAASPPLPAELPADALPLMRALRSYQRAAALFYRGEFEAARAAFDAIVADSRHPLRKLAALGALRSIVRSATLDLEWERAFQQAYSERGLRGAALGTALAGANSRRRELFTQTQRRLEERAGELAKDTELAGVSPQMREIVVRGATQMKPERVMAALFNELSKVERNPYTDATLDRWDALYPRTLPRGAGASPNDPLRRAYAFYDWQMAIQGCNDDPRERMADARCDAEHAYALSKWQADKSAAWLVAALLTTRRPGEADLAAIAAATQVEESHAASLTLAYHAVRALRLLGRRDEARTAVERVLTRKGLDVSTLNLLRQERFALSRSVAEALPFALRSTGGSSPLGVAADGAELFDSRLASDDLLALAGDARLHPALREPLVAAAWFRADLAQRSEVALAAARLAATFMPALAPAAARYVAAATPEERRDVLLFTMMAMQWSPKVYQTARFRPGAPLPRGNPLAADWCAFDGARHATQLAEERTPPLSQELRGGAGRDEEFARLKAIGDGPAWFAREAIAAAKRRPNDPARTALLRSVVFATNADLLCPMVDAASLRAQAQQMLAGR